MLNDNAQGIAIFKVFFSFKICRNEANNYTFTLFFSETASSFHEEPVAIHGPTDIKNILTKMIHKNQLFEIT